MDTESEKPIRIGTGRQLFVDDFLIEAATLQRTFHKPRVDPSPLLVPSTPAELNRGVMPAAAMASVVFDPADDLYKMWYLAGYDDGFAYATSEDGIAWTRPGLDVVPGTNRVLAPLAGYIRNGSTVCLDHDATDPAERFKMFAFHRAGTGDWPRRDPVPMPAEHEIAHLYTSADGVHWKQRARTGPCGDNTSLFHDPFRNTWAYSIRTFRGAFGRSRSYHEHADFLSSAVWEEGEQHPWLAADERDRPDQVLGLRPELYKVDCVAYESLMLGVFGLYYGPPNHEVSARKIPKTIDLHLGYSRGGLAWTRPDRSAFLECSREPGQWDRGYLQASGGVCLVVGDELRFYFSAFSGVSPAQGGGPYAGGSIGLARMRRDGFASMDGPGLPMPAVTRTGARDKGVEQALPPGALTTRSVLFSGRCLFVNANVRGGDLRAEVLWPDGSVVEGYPAADCDPAQGDSTRHPLTWRGGRDLAALAEKPVKLRFYLHSGELYSFWVSADGGGKSGGYVAAGGPGFKGARDI